MVPPLNKVVRTIILQKKRSSIQRQLACPCYKLKNTIDSLARLSSILQLYYNVDPLYDEINRGHSNISKTNIIGKTSGEKVVESSMIFTNYMVANHFLNNDLPFIYRNHQIDKDVLNRLDKIENKMLKEDNNGAYIRYIDMVKNIYPKAYYDVNCVGHEGLGINCYTHVTSPLRRMADVVASICLNKLYFNSYDDKTKEEVKKMILTDSKKINDKRDAIERFEIEYELNK